MYRSKVFIFSCLSTLLEKQKATTISLYEQAKYFLAAVPNWTKKI